MKNEKKEYVKEVLGLLAQQFKIFMPSTYVGTSRFRYRHNTHLGCSKDNHECGLLCITGHVTTVEACYPYYVTYFQLRFCIKGIFLT